MPQTTHAPIIHLNGSPAQDLLDLREAAYAAITDAMDALASMAPNGRDYYPDPGRMTRAEECHRARQQALQGILDGIQAEVDAILEQHSARTSSR